MKMQAVVCSCYSQTAKLENSVPHLRALKTTLTRRSRSATKAPFGDQTAYYCMGQMMFTKYIVIVDDNVDTGAVRQSRRAHSTEGSLFNSMQIP